MPRITLGAVLALAAASALAQPYPSRPVNFILPVPPGGALDILAQAGSQPIGLTFVPHLTPMIRGIHATLYARITRDTDFQKLFEDRYRGEAFVDVLPPGRHPDTRSVRASNLCRIAVHRPQGCDTLVVLSVIDNLTKGAAGQAVQNMNLLFGFPETTGLDDLPIVP